MAFDQMRRYPIGIQTFGDIRTNNYVYVDKTEYVWRLAHESGKSFFLSRPRRFGKSLLLSTMESYFSGKRELFESLAVENLEKDWETYPVIRLDLSSIKAGTLDELKTQLGDMLTRLELQFKPAYDASTLGARLANLIEAAYKQTGKQVVVLVDEYDAPLLNVIDNEGMLKQFRQVMRGFYIPLKSSDQYLRFVFLTGITKFSQLSIFSELNNLYNLSMDPEYAAICGITEEELHDQLDEDVALLASRLQMAPREAYTQLKNYYDGYHFCEPSPDIYNPFSLMTAFKSGSISSYWFGSGTPTSLIKLIQANGWEIVDLENREALASEFDIPTEQITTPLPMLYQAGYVTIKEFDRESNTYTLGIPNKEVSRGLSENLVSAAAPNAYSEHTAFLRSFAKSLRSNNVEAALAAMKSYLAGIPYHLASKDERGFETIFYLVFDLLGIQIETEFKTTTGRINAVVTTRTTVYVFEFKYDKSAKEALKQINSKDYAIPFVVGDRSVVKVGVNYSSKERTINEWLVG